MIRRLVAWIVGWVRVVRRPSVHYSLGFLTLGGFIAGIVFWGGFNTAMKQNLVFALVYNALGVPVAAGILYPFFGILLSPMIAAVAMGFAMVK